AMLGQPVSMLIPKVVGFKLTGELPEGSTATDLVLTVTQMLRELGVVGKFVEFYGPGLPNLALADRATIGNMSPEMGATCAIFPVDKETLRYLEFSGRPTERLELVEAYTRAQGMFHDENYEEATYSDTIELDLSEVEPSMAGPKRPQDRVPLSKAAEMFKSALAELDADGNGGSVKNEEDKESADSFPASDAANAEPGDEDDGADNGFSEEGAPARAQATATAEHHQEVEVELDGETFPLSDGAVVIAAITSCTNTSNPSVMLGSGLLAKNAVERGLTRKPWVKTSLAPGSKVVTDYLAKADLQQYLDELGFTLVGYGCTTCIGNSGPLQEEISKAIDDNDLTVASVLSGNRNFEGRIHPEVKMNYLASPPLCVAYALAGRMDVDLLNDPLGQDQNGDDVYLRDIWPSQADVNEAVSSAVESDMFRSSYGDTLFEGDENWQGLEIPEGDRYEWQPESTYVRQPPYFEGMEREPREDFPEIKGARCIAKLGDSVTTDHISPAGAIKEDSPAGRYLKEHDVEKKDFNSYGSRRGNHEVMVRGTFANVRIRNQLAPGTEGGVTTYFPDDEQMSIYDAAMKYAENDTPLCVLAGKEYGSGSSRDWAAKGPNLQGIKFVIAESYERIHRSNLVGMGILPLQFPDGENVESLGLTGEETFDLELLEDGARTLKVKADDKEFEARVRIDTPNEWLYYRHGGILLFVLRQLLEKD
ncbi:MAG: aconitate hydratase, partial [Thermoleophilaceae bacterium]|nr:aconitate hydratase [Thermoleophilaceae bacterium]